MKKISPCLWFDKEAHDAAKFYASVFPHVKIGTIAHYGKSASAAAGQPAGSVLTVDFEIEGLPVVGLNGGPVFKHNPSLSFFVYCRDEKEIDDYWAKLSAGGEVRMGLDKYPWSPKYGWVADKFGIDWQLILGERKDKLAPSFLFVEKLFGRGQEAIDFYVSLFPNSKIEQLTKAEDGRSVLHCAFQLNGRSFNLMEGQGAHNFAFNEAFSFQVFCEDQKEIDFYWEKLMSGGGSPSQCGWLKDKFGVSWQVVPAGLAELMGDAQKSEKVMHELVKMTKLDWNKLTSAAKG